MSGTRIRHEVKDGIARLTLCAPHNRNAIDSTFCREFAEAALSISTDPSAVVALMRAEGDFFSVGGDFKDFLAHKDGLERHVLDMATHLHIGIVRLQRAPAPLVVAVNGTAAGGGFSLVLGADIAIARRSAKLVAAYTRSGLTPDGGGTYFLPRIVGLKRAFDILATNPTLSAEQALELGILSRVVDDEAFEAEVEALVRQLAATPRHALHGLKRLLRESPSASLQQQLDLEAESIAATASHPDSISALESFLAKRSK